MKCETQSTASSFFEVICQQIEVEVYSLTLEAAYIGKTKEALDSTDLNIDLKELISFFRVLFDMK